MSTQIVTQTDRKYFIAPEDAVMRASAFRNIYPNIVSAGNGRLDRALDYASTQGKIEKDNDDPATYTVHSMTRDRSYSVDTHAKTCDCPDGRDNGGGSGIVCKHRIAVALVQPFAKNWLVTGRKQGNLIRAEIQDIRTTIKDLITEQVTWLDRPDGDYLNDEDAGTRKARSRLFGLAMAYGRMNYFINFIYEKIENDPGWFMVDNIHDDCITAAERIQSGNIHSRQNNN